MAAGIIVGTTAVVANPVQLFATKTLTPVSINGIEFDAMIEEDRTLSADVPEYVVEDGYSISDSIITQSEELSMTLVVTDTPVTFAERHSEGDRLQNVLSQLEELFYKRELCSVSMPERVYKDMAITSIQFSKSLEVGNSREIPITLKSVRKTKIETTTYPAGYGKSGKSGAAAGSANVQKSNTSKNGNPLSTDNANYRGSTILGAALYGTSEKDYKYKGETTNGSIVKIKGAVK
jgi:hypothetical protein